MSRDGDPPRCLVACGDLMGWSRLANLVRAADCLPVQVRGVEGLQGALAEGSARAVVVDLADRAGGPEVVEAAAKLPGRPAWTLVALGPHKEAALLKRARDAGADAVLPNSAAADRLPGLLAADR